MRNPLLRVRNLANGALSRALALQKVLTSWLDPSLRPLVTEINDVRHSLPARYELYPLQEFLNMLTPGEADLTDLDPDKLRELIDALALLDRESPFGLCLRRSLLRYHFMRRTGADIGIDFGVRFRKPAAGTGIAGHAWNTLNNQPYHEQEKDYRGFTVVYRWPET